MASKDKQDQQTHRQLAMTETSSAKNSWQAAKAPGSSRETTAGKQPGVMQGAEQPTENSTNGWEGWEGKAYSVTPSFQASITTLY